MANEDRVYYRSYLLRLWRATGEESFTWRGTLECVATGERRGFADLEDLFVYLREQTSPSMSINGVKWEIENHE